MTTDLLAAAEEMLPLVRQYADEAEEGRRVPPALAEAFRDRGLYRMWLPHAIGGEELPPAEAMKVVERLAQEDASCAWSVMVAAQAAQTITGWPEASVRATFGPDDIFAGTLGMMDAVAVEGGYRVTGRAGFGSGCSIATWISGTCRVQREGAGPDAPPEMRFMFFPRSDYTIIDTWRTTGLRGTGSFDWSVENAFVPDSLVTPPAPRTYAARWGGPLYKGPFIWSIRAGVALGLARHAIETLIDLAQTKHPILQMTLLKDLPRVQDAVGRAEASFAAARLYVFDAVESAWRHLLTGEALTDLERVNICLATVHTVTTCAEIVERMYRLGGGTSIYTTSPLERCFRDINTLMADLSGSPWVVEVAGMVYLRQPLPPGMF